MLGVSYYGWILSLHLLSAFAVVASLAFYTLIIVSARRADTPDVALALGRILNVGAMALQVGMAGTIVFGLWLVSIVSGYSLANGWIVAGIALWLVIGASSGRLLLGYRTARAAPVVDIPSRGEEPPRAAPARALAGGLVLGLDLGAVAAAVALLAVMIWKPGA